MSLRSICIFAQGTRRKATWRGKGRIMWMVIIFTIDCFPSQSDVIVEGKNYVNGYHFSNRLFPKQNFVSLHHTIIWRKAAFVDRSGWFTVDPLDFEDLQRNTWGASLSLTHIRHAWHSFVDWTLKPGPDKMRCGSAVRIWIKWQNAVRVWTKDTEY